MNDSKAGLTIFPCKDPTRPGRYVLLRLVSISATVDLHLIDGALALGSSYVGDSKLELQRAVVDLFLEALLAIVQHEDRNYCCSCWR
jgi:hypothetical protein